MSAMYARAVEILPPDRPSTLARRFDAFDALKSRARLYRDILQVQVQDLDQQLEFLPSPLARMMLSQRVTWVAS